MTNRKVFKQIERYAPISSLFIVSILSFIISSYYQWNILGSKLSLLLNISFSLSAIYLGFTGTAIGLLVSIVETDLMKKIYLHNADNDLIRYIKHSSISSVILFLISIIFLLFDYGQDENIPPILFSFWLGIFVSTFLYAIRIIYFIFLIMIYIVKRKRDEFKKPKNIESIPKSSISTKTIRKNPFE